ncbi:MAG: hypothetical protein KDA24_02690 [Deltaproteobacteria bacterium]|nr:hypothetical protein [Deltaproteobacteria bacterium]
MASDFGKLLDKIQSENSQLATAHARLGKAYEKLDGRLTRFNAKARIEPYEVDKKSGLKIGYRRYERGWNISTIIEGVAGLEAEVPVRETPPKTQAALMPHVAGLLTKIGAALAEDVKSAKKATVEADRLLDALP